MALLDPTRSDSPTVTALVAALVIVHEGSALSEVLAAVERSVYEPEAVWLVGGGAGVAEAHGEVRWVPSVADGMAALDPSITHVWLLHDDSIPRPDALGALVHEGQRVGADLVGSKVLVAGRPGVLESVGLATDVFEVPASGLDVEELDQEQYDVLRDVAFVAGSSMLINREMLDRVGGPDRLLEPITAAIDLCQRVHLAGGRVMVVPSAEVLHDGTCVRASSAWRVEAGRLRAMLKAYSPVTLVWSVPFFLMLGLGEALIAPLFGRWRLFAVVRAWVWNLWRLPSTLAARRRVERVVGDAELFRFQVRGSVRLTAFGRRAADTILAISASERARSLGQFVESSGETVRRPVVASVLAGVGFALFAARQLWFDGLADAGYALAPPAAVAGTLRAFAGGWNPADLGSPEPLRPVLGAVSLVQVAVLGRASLALVVLVVAAAVAGVVGVARLLGPFGIRPVSRYAAGIVLIAGPAARVLAGRGIWHGMVAMAVLPWILAVVLHRRRTAAAIAVAALLTAVSAAFLPLMLLLPSTLVLLWVLIEPAGGRSFTGRVVVAAVLAAPALLPWLAALDDVGYFFTSGSDFYWTPSAWVVVLIAVVAGCALVGADRPIIQVAGWGALAAAGGSLLARSGGFGWGTDPGATGMVAVGLGVAVLVGAGLETALRTAEARGSRRLVRVAGGLASLLLLVGVVTVALPGRLGFPGSGLTETLSFTAQSEPGRALLLGDEDFMPGGGKLLPGGTHYRVVSTPAPRLWEAWPSSDRPGDIALADTITAALSGSTFRLGEELASFGIGWIITSGPGPVSDVMDAQLDLLPLAIPDTRAYQVEAAAPQAVDISGVEWIRSGVRYLGPAGGGTVRLATNADRRWGESSTVAPDGWASIVTTASSVIEFGPISRLRTAALVSLIWTGLLVLATAAIRERADTS